MPSTSLKDSLLNDVSLVHDAYYVAGQYRNKRLYQMNFFDYLIIKCFYKILNDNIPIDDYAEIAKYKEKLTVVVSEDMDGCLFLQSLQYGAKPTSCFLIAKQLKLFFEKHDMWHDIDKVIDLKARKVIKSTGTPNALVVTVFDANHVALYKPINLT